MLGRAETGKGQKLELHHQINHSTSLWNHQTAATDGAVRLFFVHKFTFMDLLLISPSSLLDTFMYISSHFVLMCPPHVSQVTTCDLHTIVNLYVNIHILPLAKNKLIVVFNWRTNSSSLHTGKKGHIYCTKKEITMYDICQIYKNAVYNKFLITFQSFIELLLTKQIPKLHNFSREYAGNKEVAYIGYC